MNAVIVANIVRKATAIENAKRHILPTIQIETMSKGYTVSSTGRGVFIVVCNFEGLNEVANYCYSNIAFVQKNKNTIGMWKIKKK